MGRLGIKPLLTVATLCAISPAAFSQSFDIHAPDSATGSRELESLNGVNLGPAKEDRAFARNSHEFKYTYGMSDFWRVELGALVESPGEADMRFSRVSFENTFVLRPNQKYGIGLGAFSALDVATSDRAHNGFVFGPIVQLNADKTTLLVNAFFDKTFGQNAEPGLALFYIWRGRHELRKGFGIGLTGAGRIDNLGSGTPWSEQEHRVGPTLFFHYDVGDGREVEISLGTLFGLTRTTPDAAVMFNIGVPLPRLR